MTELITILPADDVPVFPVEVDRLEWSTDDPGDSFDVTLTLGTETVLEATLTSGADRVATLYGIASLLIERMDTPGERSLDICWGQQCYTHPLLVLACRTNVGVPAAGFTQRRFLTLLDGNKPVPPGGTEKLRWYDPGTPDRTYGVRLRWYNLDSRAITEESLTQLALGSGGISEADVSPSSFTPPTEGLLLLDYEVTAGLRKQHYVVVPSSMAATEVAFRNAFGLADTFYFRGHTERVIKAERQQADFCGIRRNYSSKVHSEMTMHTGILTDPLLPLLEDLMATDIAYLRPHMTPLVITDNDAKLLSDLHAANAASVTFRQAAVNERAALRDRIRTFDQTFDQTFK